MGRALYLIRPAGRQANRRRFRAAVPYDQAGPNGVRLDDLRRVRWPRHQAPLSSRRSMPPGCAAHDMTLYYTHRWTTPSARRDVQRRGHPPTYARDLAGPDLTESCTTYTSCLRDNGLLDPGWAARCVP